MLKFKSSRAVLVVVAAAVLIIMAGGAAVASNMGFKLNKGYVKAPPGATATSNTGKNWTSIPYNNPYTTGCVAPATNCAKALCDSEGFNIAGCGGAFGVVTTVRKLDPVTGNFATTNCPGPGGTTGNGFSLIPGEFVEIRVFDPCTVTSGIIVGSHNPTLAISVPPAGAGLIGRKWWAVPYHTTAVNTRDACVQAGLKLTVPAATLTLIDPTTGNFSNNPCSANPGSPIVLGAGYQITNPTAATVTFIPAHF